MKTTHRWLESLCPHGRSPEEAAGILQSLGHEVAGLTPLPDGDTLIELEITANRPDCLSALGLAHELSAATGAAVRPPIREIPPAQGIPLPEVQVAEPALCPRYAARLIRGVRVGPSPAWLAGRLEALGLKPVSNVVDVTNHVLFEMGQPLHAFDAGRLAGGIRVRRAARGERLRTLDGVERALTPEMLVIADAGRPVALAGIMGGMDTAVTAATRDILLESAVFEPALIRRTAKALNLASDASYRFERGVDPEGVGPASDRAAALIRELAGGEIGPLAALPDREPSPPPSFRLRAARLEAILGFRIAEDDLARILTGLGCRLTPIKGGWELSPPSRRARDLRREAEAAEELARVYGYDRIPGRITLPAAAGSPDPARRLAALLSERLRAAGFSEAVTTSFTDEAGARIRVPDAAPEEAPLKLANPMSAGQTHLRRSLLPGLMAVLAHNQSAGEPGGRFFEIGRVYGKGRESWRLALAAEAGLREVLGALEAALAGLRLELEAAPGEGGPALAAGRALRLGLKGGEALGAAGAAEASWVGRLDLRREPVLAEIALAPLLPAMDRTAAFRPLPRFPAVDRDLAVVVDDALPWARIERAALSVPCPFRERLAFFDLYRGRQAGAGRKSVAFSIRFRHPDRTLTGEEVDEVMARTIAALERDCGAAVRR